MAPKRSKNQLRREKLKQRKLEEKSKGDENTPKPEEVKEPEITTAKEETKTEPTIDISTDTPLFEQFRSILNKFSKNESKEEQLLESQEETQDPNTNPSEAESYDDEDDSDSDDQDQPKQLSKRQLRIQNKIPLGKLKAYSKFPQLVEIHDVDSSNPYLLIAIKSQPNMVPVPSNWSSKRDYLSSKRGIEKLPFQLPKYIQATGISEMRSTGASDGKTLRQQQRERVQPKMGTLDMDYEKLHDAFYKNQTKPRLFAYGELFEEGKESNDELAGKILRIKPGVISKTLRNALGMPEDDTSIPPAWITIMKDIGKPPSYQELIIPGLDIGYSNTGYKDQHSGDSKRHGFKHWGRLNALMESDDESEEEEEEEEEEEVEEAEEEEGAQEETKPAEPTLNDILSGLSAGAESNEPKEDKKLYKVLKETKLEADSVTGHTYDLGHETQKESPTPKTEQKEVSQEEEHFKF